MVQMLALDRDQTLQILSCIGVDLPPHTKLSDDALDDRLRKALNAAQTLSIATRTPSSLPVTAYPVWPKTGGKSVFEASIRTSIAEAQEVHGKRLAGISPVAELRVNPFVDLRQTISHLGKNWDQGNKMCLILDSQVDEASRIPMHVRVSEESLLAPSSR